MSTYDRKETPCAETSPSPTISPTPTAAPSSIPSPVTAPTVSTAETAPGEQSKLYLNSQKSAAYRCSPEGTLQFYLFSGRPKWMTSLHLVEQRKKNNPDKPPPAQWLDWWAGVNLGWTEITQKEFDDMCKVHAMPANAAVTLPDTASPSSGTSATNDPGASVSLAERTSRPATSPASPATAPLQAPATALASNAASEIVNEDSELDTPAFDYSCLDEDTAYELRGITECVMELQANYAWGMAYQVGKAHDLLCGENGACKTVLQAPPRNNQYSEATFTAWCAYIGVNRQTAYNLLNAYRLISKATPEQQTVLQTDPARLLYAAGKKDAPEHLVNGVLSGDITTHKQYQELLKQYRDTLAENQQLREGNSIAQRTARQADEARKAAEAEREQAIIDRDTARDAQTNSAHLANMIAGQRDEARLRAAEAEKQRDAAQQAAQDAQARIRELEARPVEVIGASSEDIAKWRAEGAAAAKKELQSALRQAQKEAEAQRRRAELAEEDSEQASQEAQDYAAQLGQARQQLEQGEAVRMVRQATDACEALLRPQLYALDGLGRDDYKAAMALLEELRDKLIWATMNDAWPGDDWPDGYYYDDGSDEPDGPDEWEDEEE